MSKMTKRSAMEFAIGVFNGVEFQNAEDMANAAAAKEVFEKAIEQMDKENAMRKEREAAKAPKEDPVLDKVEAVLDGSGKTQMEVWSAIGDTDISTQAIMSKLEKLVRDGKATKEKVTTDDKKTKTLYKRA